MEKNTVRRGNIGFFSGVNNVVGSKKIRPEYKKLIQLNI
jgi:hypothetical protein